MDKTDSPAPERFPLTLAAAAEISGLTPREICDYIRAGALSYAFRATGALGTSIWLSHEDIRAIIRDPDQAPIPLEKMSVEQRKILESCQAVRSFLDSKLPRTRADEAGGMRAPLIVQTRQRVPFLCVRISDVTAHARALGRYPLAQLDTVVTWALERVGADQVRGVRGLDDKRQSWTIWHRLPHSLATPSTDDEHGWIADLPQLDPERLTSPSGEPGLLIKSVD